MRLEADDAQKAIMEYERMLREDDPQDLTYRLVLSRPTLEMLACNIGHRMDSERFSIEERDVLTGIWNKFESSTESGECYPVKGMDLSQREIMTAGKVMLEAVNESLGRKGGADFCRNATNMFMEMSDAFIAIGGSDNGPLRTSFEKVRDVVGQ